ncbi:MAG: Crp/Fnr family transcriptional regulator [Anaerovoracaceae bacterium]|nr:Crp/Fnr family transcriptional regulator [Bacillota bacterium]MDY2670102.1 Crp/Fnr family transcriptional regulator [Anaerovoracaceae bacterium]
MQSIKKHTLEGIDFSRIALFHGMSPEETKSALNALDCYIREYEKGSVILRAGETTDSIGIVLEGSVTIENIDVWGNRTILNMIEKNGFFAETYAILRDQTLLINACANERCRIMFIRVFGRSDIEPGSWHSRFLFNLMTITARKNYGLSARSLNTAPKTVRGRVMTYLNFMSIKNGKMEFEIHFDRQQMADYLNVERTALSKELSKMKKEGIINYRKNYFVLKNRSTE